MRVVAAILNDVGYVMSQLTVVNCRVEVAVHDTWSEDSLMYSRVRIPAERYFVHLKLRWLKTRRNAVFCLPTTARRGDVRLHCILHWLDKLKTPDGKWLLSQRKGARYAILGEQLRRARRRR